MRNRVIRWSDLGSPTGPSIYQVEGVGEVQVEQADIDLFAVFGIDPLVEIIETTPATGTTKSYFLGHFMSQKKGGRK